MIRGIKASAEHLKLYSTALSVIILRDYERGSKSTVSSPSYNWLAH